MSSETYANLIEECDDLNMSILNLIAELKTFTNQILSVKTKPTETEVIELYNKSQSNNYKIDKLCGHNRKLNCIIEELRNYYCKHDRIVDRENFDIGHTCYVCSKCGMIM